MDRSLLGYEKPDERIRRILLAEVERSDTQRGSESPKVHQKSVFLTQRVHLFPFRTQKLSFAVPTILAWRRAGKIGQSRHTPREERANPGGEGRRTEKSGEPISPKENRKALRFPVCLYSSLAQLVRAPDC